jgi:23S rRNA (uracil1939-C5)-methyltransferase
MPLHPGDEIELAIEKPAAGGRMIARHHGRVVLVQGAIPGERVRSRVQRVERHLAFADTVEVLQRSEDRREPAMDPSCGGCLYAHVSYARQLTLKTDVIRDAFARVGRIALDGSVAVAPSPERGYRMRARLHVRGGQVGFYREGTHDVCDAASTGQLSDDAVASASRAVASLAAAGSVVSAVELAENIAANERILHVTSLSADDPTNAALDDALAASGLTGCSARTNTGMVRTAGIPFVTDPLAAVTAGRAATGVLQRRAESFFQANRYLLPQLVTTVLDGVRDAGEVLDLYAGVGLFSIALAATGHAGVTAVEGDRTSGSDLQRNAAANGATVRVVIGNVEEHLSRRTRAAETMIVDPSRTGISREAMQSIMRQGAPRVIYVSCDAPTMARDARRLLDGGYRMVSLQGFDLFPNTPHVEAVAIFDRAIGGAGVDGEEHITDKARAHGGHGEIRMASPTRGPTDHAGSLTRSLGGTQ